LVPGGGSDRMPRMRTRWGLVGLGSVLAFAGCGAAAPGSADGLWHTGIGASSPMELELDTANDHYNLSYAFDGKMEQVEFESGDLITDANHGTLVFTPLEASCIDKDHAPRSYSFTRDTYRSVDVLHLVGDSGEVMTLERAAAAYPRFNTGCWENGMFTGIVVRRL
jgi:hypothetical protein